MINAGIYLQPKKMFFIYTLQVVLKAGDILYIPQHWWHHVRSFDCPNIAISLWFHPFAEKEDEEKLETENETEDVRTHFNINDDGNGDGDGLLSVMLNW